MTICIAAACGTRSTGYKLVLCADRQTSSALGRSESMMKIRRLRNFRVLTAGKESEILGFVALLDQEAAFSDKNVSRAALFAAIRNALHLRKLEKATELTEGKFGMKYEDFLAVGKDQLPAEIFRERILDIERIDLESCFIVAGFVAGVQIIVEVHSDFRISELESFAAIGEGEYLASASLMQREYTEVMQPDRAIYCVYEAKKAAERVASVGRSTLLLVMEKDGAIRSVTGSGMNALESMHSDYGPKAVPTDLELGPTSFTKW